MTEREENKGEISYSDYRVLLGKTIIAAFREAVRQNKTLYNQLPIWQAETFFCDLMLRDSTASTPEESLRSYQYKNGDAFETANLMHFFHHKTEKLFEVEGLIERAHEALGEYVDVKPLEEMAEALQKNASKSGPESRINRADDPSRGR